MRSLDGVSIVPDIAVFVWSRIPTDNGDEIANAFPLAPDWTIEILSPELRPTRATKNILRCLRNRAEMGWLIDPEDRSAFVYRAGQEVGIADEPEAVLPMPTFMADMNYRVADLFGLLQL